MVTGRLGAVALSLACAVLLLAPGCQGQRTTDAHDSPPVYFVSANVTAGDQVNATISLYQRLGERMNVTISGASSDPRFAFRLVNVDGTYNPVGEPSVYPVNNDLWTYPRVNVLVADAPIPPGHYAVHITADFGGGRQANCTVPIEVVERMESRFWWLPVQE